ncbi:5-dehydro-4-deoxyglucarate dehydratase [Agrococcus jenensis]|uniref:Probable 5-dehydro-4-deoxyglucarate dehydratase n=1 Tax=Agrococcus jenensis TaxID=46353 RepID=A0A3N2AQ67_9MICO|nr:5-dehydro-4-deoxyglucarate dehydratase [Agrococcus jenensis]ROR65184.1 5-dehydro-4-deoxyglucarate dehydratase [Agrococcus jenensis]
MHASHQELASRLGDGLLSFPITTFDAAGDLDAEHYREHVAWLSQHDVSGLFAAGGTGEFFSLTPDEVADTIRLALDASGGAVPILAPAGGSTRSAQQHARIAEDAGAAGLLLFPPYLTEASQEGLRDHIRAVASSTRLPVIVYGRANAVLEPDTLERLADECPNLIGYKDGIGDLERMTRIVATVGDRLLYVGGLPTAETFALPYLELGVTTYSSAMFNFVPEFATAFYADVRAHDRAAVTRRLKEFVLPYLEIRDRGRGYAVSIVKAGVDAIGRYGGPVRPPLSELRPDERQDLAALIARVAQPVVA